MLGAGKLLTRMLLHVERSEDRIALDELTPYRPFGAQEALR